jgi:hypothetical protein
LIPRRRGQVALRAPERGAGPGFKEEEATMKLSIMTFAVLLMGAAGHVHAGPQLHLDASSDATAEASWKAMLHAAGPTERQALLAAMIKINLAGVDSAEQVVEDPDLQRLGIVRIKDRVAGLTSEQIIPLGNRVSKAIVEKPGP